jgi:hypothetical protein
VRKKSPRKKSNRERFTERELRPYVTAIGQLSLAWNALHEQLAAIFRLLLDRQITKIDEYGMEDGGDERPIKLWTSSKFDRPKRDMLKAAVSTITEEERSAFPKLVEDVTWILQRADSLEDARNDAVHSPLLLLGSNKATREVFGSAFVIPDLLHGNPRGIKLAQKDLLLEFRWCRDAALILRDFAYRISGSLSLGVVVFPWPERPSLPNRGEKSKRRPARSHLAPK